jgi:DedD protein
MAKAISDEELQLKKRARRRLVGAIALVLVVVVFLPMVLDNEPRPLSEDVEITVPPLPPEEAASSIAEPPVAMQSTPDDPVASENAAPAPVATPAPAPSPKPAAAPPAPAASKPVAAKPPAPQGAPEAYVVQLGAFSNADNARQLASKVRDNRFKAYTEVLKTPNGERTRVRVGPYPTRDAAEKARDRLKSLKLTLGEPAVLKADE